MKIISVALVVINFLYKLISNCYAFRPVFIACGFFATRKFKKAEKLHKYAVLIAARNEETVIGNLIDSIHSQDYPQELVDIFVVADNCTDNTARISREKGACCYERFDNKHRTKGFALQYLVRCIDRDYGIKHYEGYFIFDADNLLKKDYISRMNDSFDAGEKIITSYRNTKNFADNCIAASYGIHWLRTVRTEHRARSLFHLATRIQGTGFLFANEVIKNGWNYTGFTEDRAFCADAVANGYKISYNDKAEFYDEQPTNLKIAMRQRIRWAKGHLQAVAETGPTLLSHIFVTKGAANRHLKKGESSKVKRLFNNIRLRFMSFDMLTVVFPFSLSKVIHRLINYILEMWLIILSVDYFSTISPPTFLAVIFKWFGINPTTDRLSVALLLFTAFTMAKSITTILTSIITAAYVFIIERKRIMKIKWYKKVWFCLTFPMFDIIGKISSCIALFKKVEWKPIPHTDSSTIEQVDQKINLQK